MICGDFNVAHQAFRWTLTCHALSITCKIAMHGNWLRSIFISLCYEECQHRKIITKASLLAGVESLHVSLRTIIPPSPQAQTPLRPSLPLGFKHLRPGVHFPSIQVLSHCFQVLCLQQGNCTQSCFGFCAPTV